MFLHNSHYLEDINQKCVVTYTDYLTNKIKKKNHRFDYKKKYITYNNLNILVM